MSETTAVYLVRHAHAEWRTGEDRPLSVDGRAAALRLARLFERVTIDAIYSSPSARAIETVAPLAVWCQLNPIVINDLRERELPTTTASEFAAAVRASWERPEVAAVAGGESNRTAQGRAIAVVHRVLTDHAGRAAVISTHGNLLALILNGFDAAFAYDFWHSLTFPDVYELTFDNNALAGVRRFRVDG